ncbi:hypothetical protein E0Z10_g2701 [Xylaria hypoxylon]|uniref:Uncharacterized protein n=1 Tax=Xylaria hypoxylon TaxID=37992 RepID=A0A4Z0Z3E1_9PEZI|nr:hypothetical protein E0Z10_g2701 [Xylaria hypoxylon]
MSFLVYPSYAYTLPVYATKRENYKETPTLEKPENFARDFGIAVGLTVTIVVVGMVLICVFAHFWRHIIDCGQGAETRLARKKRRSNKEAWFCGPDRGLPMPQFEILEPETEPLSPYAHGRELSVYPGPAYAYDLSAEYACNRTPDLQPRSKTNWNTSVATLPSWFNGDEIERPVSIAYFLDRP